MSERKAEQLTEEEWRLARASQDHEAFEHYRDWCEYNFPWPPLEDTIK
jgi:hypothetical protein